MPQLEIRILDQCELAEQLPCPQGLISIGVVKTVDQKAPCILLLTDPINRGKVEIRFVRHPRPSQQRRGPRVIGLVGTAEEPRSRPDLSQHRPGRRSCGGLLEQLPQHVDLPIGWFARRGIGQRKHFFGQQHRIALIRRLDHM